MHGLFFQGQSTGRYFFLIIWLLFIIPFHVAAEDNDGPLKIPKIRPGVVENECPQCQEASDQLLMKKIDRATFNRQLEEARRLEKEAALKNAPEGSYMAEVGRYELMVRKVDAQIEALQKELENCRKGCGKKAGPRTPPVSVPPGSGDDGEIEPSESFAHCPDCEQDEQELNEKRTKLKEVLKFQKTYDAECEQRLKEYWDKDKKVNELRDQQKRYKKGSIEEHVIEVQIEEIKKQMSELGIQTLGDEERRWRIIKEIERLRQEIDALYRAIAECNWGCPPEPQKCPEGPFRPVKIGEQSKYGSGASNTAKDVAKNVLGGLMGGLFGGGGGGGDSPGSMSGPADSPPLDSNPFSKMKSFADPGTGTSIALAGKQTDKGFLIAAGIEDGSGNPTIHSMTLHRDDDCSMMMPSEYHLYQLWGKWWISVSWTRTTYVNNQVTSRTSGGWSSSGTIPVAVFAPGGEGSVWQSLGFDKATGGPRTVGAEYIVPQGAPLKFPDKAVVHVTRPDKDPVTTVPFVFKVSQEPGGTLGFQQIMPGTK